MLEPKFPLGRAVMTSGVAEMVKKGLDPVRYLVRHVQGDWGDVGPEDWYANQRNLKRGGRLFSAYKTSCGKVWVITERDRSITTVLLPGEY